MKKLWSYCFLECPKDGCGCGFSRFKRWATGEVVLAISRFQDDEAAEYWAWGMTPMPFGEPSWEQFYFGMVLAFTGKDISGYHDR